MVHAPNVGKEFKVKHIWWEKCSLKSVALALQQQQYTSGNQCGPIINTDAGKQKNKRHDKKATKAVRLEIRANEGFHGSQKLSWSVSDMEKQPETNNNKE